MSESLDGLLEPPAVVLSPTMVKVLCGTVLVECSRWELGRDEGLTTAVGSSTAEKRMIDADWNTNSGIWNSKVCCHIYVLARGPWSGQVKHVADANKPRAMARLWLVVRIEQKGLVGRPKNNAFLLVGAG